MAETNYTPEMVNKLLQLYTELGNDGIEEIAKNLNKTVRSVRSKLVKLGAYTPSPKVSKADGPSKKHLLRELESLGFDTSGFEGSTKTALHRLLGIVKQ
jgi:hypothetical protein